MSATLEKVIDLGTDPQTRLKRFETRTEKPLAYAAAAFLLVYSLQVLAHLSGPWKVSASSEN